MSLRQLAIKGRLKARKIEDRLQMVETKASRRKNPLVILIAIVCSCPITCLALWVLSTSVPFYVELNIPDIGPAETIRSTFSWGDTVSNHFIWRRQILVTAEGYDTWDTIMRYYDGYLTEQGWKLYDDDEDYYGSCNGYMPETELLNLGRGGYVYYRRHDAEEYYSGPIVCLAVLNDNYVVLQTINPSFMSALGHDMDRY
jgi:hypothetical protein